MDGERKMKRRGMDGWVDRWKEKEHKEVVGWMYGLVGWRREKLDENKNRKDGWVDG
jgi:hypothetical protein